MELSLVRPHLRLDVNPPAPTNAVITPVANGHDVFSAGERLRQGESPL